MNGLIIWIIIIAISSLVKNANKKKKQEQKKINNLENYDERVYGIKPKKNVFNEFIEAFEDNEQKRENLVKNEKVQKKVLKKEKKQPVYENNNLVKKSDDFKKIKGNYENRSLSDKKTDSNYMGKKHHTSNLKISLSKNSLVNGVILSEIIGKPKGKRI